MHVVHSYVQTVAEFSREDQRLFLKYVTSCSKVDLCSEPLMDCVRHALNAVTNLSVYIPFFSPRCRALRVFHPRSRFVPYSPRTRPNRRPPRPVSCPRWHDRSAWAATGRIRCTCRRRRRASTCLSYPCTVRMRASRSACSTQSAVTPALSCRRRGRALVYSCHVPLLRAMSRRKSRNV